jgi:hypothetical protein
MTEQAKTIEVVGFVVEGTGQAKTTQLSDISMTGLFNAHVATINSERQAIWQRYNIMVFANSIIFSLSISQITDYGTETITGAAVGLVLCLIWWKMFRGGLALYDFWKENAATFSWQGLGEDANPYAIEAKLRKSAASLGKANPRFVYRGGVLTIVIFGLGYVGLLVAEGYDQWRLATPQTSQIACGTGPQSAVSDARSALQIGPEQRTE